MSFTISLQKYEKNNSTNYSSILIVKNIRNRTEILTYLT